MSLFTRTVSAILAYKLSALIGRRGEVNCLSVEIPCSFFIERTTRKFSQAQDYISAAQWLILWTFIMLDLFSEARS